VTAIVERPLVRARTLSTVRAYVALTKPRIIELLLVTTLPAMLLAAGGWPSTRLVVATLVGGTLAARRTGRCRPGRSPRGRRWSSASC
jgi:protoheme IX farnesyltransferase